MNDFLSTLPRDLWFFLGLAAIIFISWKVLAISIKSLIRVLLLALLCYGAWHLYHAFFR